MSSERAVRAIQARQLGLVTATQAADVGMSRKAVAHRAATGAWVRVLPAVYRDALVVPTAAQSALATVLWAGAASLASHRAAGGLYGLDGIEAPMPEIWVPSARRLRSDVVLVHRGEVPAVDRRMVGPIPVTSPARTLIDLAGVLGDEDLAAALEDAIHRGLTTPVAVARRLDVLGGKGRPGSARLRAILDDRGSGAAGASRLEVRIWRTLSAAGLRPVRQHVVRVGARSFRVDCAFPAHRLAVEGVGDRYHRSPLQRRRDQQRLADLASVSWRVMPVTWHDISDAPDRVVTRVVRALSDAA